MTVLLAYVALFFLAWSLTLLAGRKTPRLTFGDASSVRPSRLASVLSVGMLFLIWGAFTGSTLVPLHVPGPFVGDTSFSYTAEDGRGGTGQATVTVRVHRPGERPDKPDATGGSGIARDDSEVTPAWRSALVKPATNDAPGAFVTAIDGHPVRPGQAVQVADGDAVLTPKGSISFTPDAGWQMEPIWLPSPEAVAARLVEIARDGYQNHSLWEHLGYSLWRVLAGLVLGTLVGVPLGYAMGLSGWIRGWFDPIVEFMRPVPPLALIPLVIIWFGIWESGKIVLLFLAALWIMVIAARNGITGVRLSKVHAAYSLGASRGQVLRHVIIPNSLPEIFTGLRVALGVCWGTVVAAELVAAEKGAGMMILVASKFQLTDIVVMGILLIGFIGYGIDILMRLAERRLVPWRGKG
ncbi:ABC transporter permease subunit [Rhodobacter sp. Har01]|uniref:ABC transporter permease subunit n=1 Tax=Rhodobacter sp. Har01 TaxID=2883999 RepID=UPI001D06D73F|nr:ABC transporter permease subunit [Rhodobacter sp. Har01]MCB6179973.1 ABC transporter permease subunit [Rhodobacter sp. Har01]